MVDQLKITWTSWQVKVHETPKFFVAKIMQLIFWSIFLQIVFDSAKSSIFHGEFYRARPCRYRAFDRLRQLE